MEAINNFISKFDKQSGVRLIAFVLFMIAAVALIAHRGFHYAYYKPTYELSFAQELTPSMLDNLSGAAGVARVDRAEQTVHIQGATDQIPALLSGVKDITGEEPQVVMLDEIVSTSMLLGVVYAAVLFAILFIAVVFVMGWRAQPYRNARAYAYLILKIGMATAIALLVYAGIVSAFSRIYLLTEVSFAVMMLVGMWLFVLLMVNTVSVVSASSATEPSILLLDIEKVLRRQFIVSVRIGLVTVAALILGLGVSFAIEGLMLLIGLMVVGFFVSLLLPRISWPIEMPQISFRRKAVQEKTSSAQTSSRPQRKSTSKSSKPKARSGGRRRKN